MNKPSIGFQAYSPLRSFSGEGVELQVFVDEDGENSDEGWGKRTHHALWEFGYAAYKALGSPDRDDLIQMRETSLEVMPELVDFLQTAIDAGNITVLGHIEAGDDGRPIRQQPTPIHDMGFEWLAHAFAKAWLSIIKSSGSINVPPGLTTDLVGILNYSILLAVDDALIAYQLGDSSAFGNSISEIAEMAHLAEEIESRPLVERSARKEVARNAAAAKLAKDPKQAAKREARKLWDDWQSGRTLHKSAAAFARYVVDSTPAIESEESVKRWDRDWRKQAKENRD